MICSSSTVVIFLVHHHIVSASPFLTITISITINITHSSSPASPPFSLALIVVYSSSADQTITDDNYVKCGLVFLSVCFFVVIVSARCALHL